MKKLKKPLVAEAKPVKGRMCEFCSRPILLDEPKLTKKMEKIKKDLAFTKDAAWN